MLMSDLLHLVCRDISFNCIGIRQHFVFYRVVYQVAFARRFDFSHDPYFICVHCLDAQTEFGRYFRKGVATNNQAQYISFARAEQCIGFIFIRRRFFGMDQCVQQNIGVCLGEIKSAIADSADCFVQIGICCAFMDIRRSA